MPYLVNMFTVRVTNTHAPLHNHKCWLLAVLDNKLDGLSLQKELLRSQARAQFSTLHLFQMSVGPRQSFTYTVICYLVTWLGVFVSFFVVFQQLFQVDILIYYK